MKRVASHIQNLPRSGIRDFFEIVSTRVDCTQPPHCRSSAGRQRHADSVRRSESGSWPLRHAMASCDGDKVEAEPFEDDAAQKPAEPAESEEGELF